MGIVKWTLVTEIMKQGGKLLKLGSLRVGVWIKGDNKARRIQGDVVSHPPKLKRFMKLMSLNMFREYI